MSGPVKRLTPPASLSKEGKDYYKSLVSMAKREYLPVAGDGPAFERAAFAFDQLRASGVFMAQAEKDKDFKAWREAQKANLEAGRMLGAALTALKLSPDVRGKKAGKGAAADEPPPEQPESGEDWGDDLG